MQRKDAYHVPSRVYTGYAVDKNIIRRTLFITDASTLSILFVIAIVRQGCYYIDKYTHTSLKGDAENARARERVERPITVESRFGRRFRFLAFYAAFAFSSRSIVGLIVHIN